MLVTIHHQARAAALGVRAATPAPCAAGAPALLAVITTTGIRPYTALVDQVMTAEPYASARRVFWIADNGASYRN
jgi:hypothetical protein